MLFSTIRIVIANYFTPPFWHRKISGYRIKKREMVIMYFNPQVQEEWIRCYRQALKICVRK
ncbi:hypothetical protein J11TS1_30050 [Oceanobacillus sp. J11TS1]|nr:hypothetical protein J11TS1_30050 [Oceanobacillus sp. J11TS1]